MDKFVSQKRKDQLNLRKSQEYPLNENEEYKVLSSPVLDTEARDSFGRVSDLQGRDSHMGSEKYRNNVRFSQNKYMDVQDVIRENKRNIDSHLYEKQKF